MSYLVRIQQNLIEDDGWYQELVLNENEAWYNAELPSCPDCGGDLVWFEAGYVPGTRKCLGKPIDDKTYLIKNGCGSMFNFDFNPFKIRRERFY